jgi:uncharacterized protein (TIGR04255 family)
MSRLSPTFENLKSPPAIEAVCDISVYEDNITDSNKFLVDSEKIRSQFPNREQINLFQGQFQIGGFGALQTANKPIGFLYKAEDGRELIQFRTTGYSYNKLAPYTGWGNFLNSALTYWEEYRSLRPSLKVSRLGLRYINMIAPEPNETSAMGLTKVSLKTPRGAKLGELKELSYRYIAEFSDLGCMASVQLGPIGSSGVGKSCDLIFDIDVYKTNVTSGIDSKSLRHHLTKMRIAKNNIFFSTLTERTLARYR